MIALALLKNEGLKITAAVDSPFKFPWFHKSGPNCFSKSKHQNQKSKIKKEWSKLLLKIKTFKSVVTFTSIQSRGLAERGQEEEEENEQH